MAPFDATFLCWWLKVVYWLDYVHYVSSLTYVWDDFIHRLISHKTGGGIEPPYSGLANHDLTTWLTGHKLYNARNRVRTCVYSSNYRYLFRRQDWLFWQNSLSYLGVEPSSLYRRNIKSVLYGPCYAWPLYLLKKSYQALSKAAISAYHLFISNLLCLWEYSKFLKKTYEISSQPLLTGINHYYVITETWTQNSASTAQYFNQLNHDHHVFHIYGSNKNRTCCFPYGWMENRTPATLITQDNFQDCYPCQLGVPNHYS